MKKILTLMMVVFMVALSVVPVFADPTNPPEAGKDTEYEDITGNPAFEFYKYLVAETGQEILEELEFEFTVSSGTATTYSAGTAGTPAVADKWQYTIPGDTEPTDYASEAEAQAAVMANEATLIEADTPVAGQYTYDGNVYDSLEAAQAKLYEDKITAVPGSAATAGTPGTFAVFAGPDPDLVKVNGVAETGNVKFPAGETMTDTKAAGDNFTLEDGKSYAKKTITLDFSGVTFDEPGIYRYVITEEEIASPYTAVDYDIQRGEAEKFVRIVDVYVVDTEEDPSATTPKLAVANTVMHEVATSVKTTDENGSKDEKATIATKWKVEGVPAPYSTDPGIVDAGYDTYDAANEARIKVREKIHDDILTESEKVDQATDALNQAVTDAQAALTAAETAQDVPGKQDAYDNAVTATQTAKNNLAAKQAELAATTDPDQIRTIRGQIDLLKVAVTNCENDELDAYNALEAAKAAVQAEQDALDAAQAALDAQLQKIQDLKDLYNTLEKDDCIKEVAWKLADKTDNYVNEIAPLYNLQFHKKVTGNQGSRDKYFAITVKIEEGENGEKLAANQVVKIDTANSVWTKEPTQTTATVYDAATMKAANNVTELTAKADGTLEHTFYLKHDEFIRLLNMPEGVKYTVTEVEEDYLKTEFTDKKATDNNGLKAVIDALDVAITAATAAGDDVKVAALTAQKTALEAKVHNDATTGALDYHKFTGYTNTKNGVIPTGVLMSVAGGAGLIALAGIGLFALNRKKDEDEE